MEIIVNPKVINHTQGVSHNKICYAPVLHDRLGIVAWSHFKLPILQSLDGGLNVYQLETAVGAAMKCFDSAIGINVPRSRLMMMMALLLLMMMMSIMMMVHWDQGPKKQVCLPLVHPLHGDLPVCQVPSCEADLWPAAGDEQPLQPGPWCFDHVTHGEALRLKHFDFFCSLLLVVSLRKMIWSIFIWIQNVWAML